jgi:hypothetical protein
MFFTVRKGCRKGSFFPPPFPFCFPSLCGPETLDIQCDTVLYVGIATLEPPRIVGQTVLPSFLRVGPVLLVCSIELTPH